MKNRHSLFLAVFILCISPFTYAQTLSLQTCLDSAEAHMPLLRQEATMQEMLNNKLEIYNKAYLPRITANGQVSYQSDVPEFPFSLPGVPGLDIPQTQYRAFAEIQQPLFDAGVSKALKAAETSRTEVSNKSLEVGKSAYKQQVAQLYFQILMAEEHAKIVSNILNLLGEQLDAVSSAVDNGVAQQNDLLRLQSEILKQQKQQNNLQSAQSSGKEILGLLTGIDVRTRTLVLPELSMPVSSDLSLNPSLELIDAQQDAVKSTDALSRGQRLPIFNAFGQAGIGAPNPYNFFEKDLSSFYIVGLRASWSIWDWGKTSLDRQNIALNEVMLRDQKSQKQLEIESSVSRLKEEHEQLTQNLETDTQIVDLQTSIREHSAIQLEQGIITLTDYMRDVLEEQTALVSLSLDHIALAQNIAKLQFEVGILR